MKNLSIIALVGKNNELGCNNDLLWEIKEDLKFYKNYTMGKYVIMGRNTYESMPEKAFIGRKPILLTSKNEENDKIKIYNDLKKLLEFIKENENEKFVVIGGAKVYEEFFPYVCEMYLTKVNAEKKADTYFPEITGDWDITLIDDYSNEEIPYIREKYVRRR